MKKMLGFTILMILVLTEVDGEGLVTQSSTVVQDSTQVVGSTTQTSTAGHPDSSAMDIVKNALDSLMGVMSLEKGTQYQKMEMFNGCFLNPQVKQKVFMSLVLPKMSGHKILKETTIDTGKIIEVDVTLQQGTKKVSFSLVYRKKQWWIVDMK